MPFRRQTSRYSQPPGGTTTITGAVSTGGRNYVSEQSGSKRHEFVSKIPQLETIGIGDYAELLLTRFRRSFGAGDDDPDTATASNNYQSS